MHEKWIWFYAKCKLTNGTWRRYILTHSKNFQTGLTCPFTTHHLIYQIVTNNYRNRNHDILHMPSSHLMKVNFSSDKGFVKMSANYLFVSIKCNSILFFITSSLRKWYLISICFILECWIRFLDKFITLVLSHKMGMHLRSI